jgi:hypothetical protein
MWFWRWWEETVFMLTTKVTGYLAGHFIGHTGTVTFSRESCPCARHKVTCGIVGRQLHTFFNSALPGEEISVSSPGPFTHGQIVPKTR